MQADARKNDKAVVIGASAGAVEALSALLPALDAGFPLPIIVVVHLPPDKNSIMADLFSGKCTMKVKEAQDKEDIRPGTIYFAPPDYHLLVEQEKTLSLSYDETVHYSRPAIDILFETASEAYGPGLTGIILTGANSDGAEGLRAVTDRGGQALVQSRNSALSPVMPAAALEKCAAAREMELADILSYLRKMQGGGA